MLYMKYRTRIQYTEADKALMWERWRRGESLHAIARLFDRNHSAIGGILSRTGGIRPPPRRRSHRALALDEREEVSRGVMAGLSARAFSDRAPAFDDHGIPPCLGEAQVSTSVLSAAPWKAGTQRACRRADHCHPRDETPESALRLPPDRSATLLYIRSR